MIVISIILTKTMIEMPNDKVGHIPSSEKGPFPPLETYPITSSHHVFSVGRHTSIYQSIMCKRCEQCEL